MSASPPPGYLDDLIDLLRHPEREVRVNAILELKRMGPGAAPAVPELTATARRGEPPPPPASGLCLVCGREVGPRTAFWVPTPDEPDGVRCCPRCRDRLEEGRPTEVQFAVEALGDIGPAAASAVSTLRAVARSFDPFLAAACRTALRTITGGPPLDPPPLARRVHDLPPPPPPPRATPPPVPDAEFIRFECPVCGKAVKAPPTATGKRVRCPRATCGQSLTVPGG